jgi:hypothetical protein
METDDLGTLREEFPGFRIWREIIWDRTRYVARGVSRGVRPHTVVTADLDELRAALGHLASPISTTTQWF